uniref:Purple acid phosphatase n=1 Tax=Glossina palpalis gambiensis TaxID=67801 RepID=A0A1B0BP11_9MUSC
MAWTIVLKSHNHINFLIPLITLEINVVEPCLAKEKMNLLFEIHLLFLLSAKKVSFVGASLYEYQPEQMHLSFGETVRDLVVTWTTNQRTNASICKYGRNAVESTKVNPESPRLFIKYIHRVTLKNLKENTCYKYYCGSDLGWSRKYWFCVPQKNENWSPSLAIYGDMGLTYAYSLPYLSDDVQNRMYNAVIHNGDFAYNLESEDGERGDLFMKQIENIAAYVPYMVNFSHYRKRFAMPGESEGLYYSFNLGPVHFVAFSTEVYFYLQFGYEPYCNQYSWLENELRESNRPENRENRPWLITYGHRPMYCSNDNINECSIKENVIRTGDPNKDLLGLEELFYNYGVDVEIWSHEHSYERSWPLYNYTVLNGSLTEPYRNPRAPVHIITGAAGNIESQDSFSGDLPEWSAFRSQVSYVHNNFVPKSTLSLQKPSSLRKRKHKETVDTSIWTEYTEVRVHLLQLLNLSQQWSKTERTSWIYMQTSETN